jgi:chromosome segregation ATPase
MIKDELIHKESLHKLIISRDEELKDVKLELEKLQNEEKGLDLKLEVQEKTITDEIKKIDKYRTDLYNVEMDLRKIDHSEHEIQADLHRMKAYQNTREADYKCSLNVLSDLEDEVKKIKETQTIIKKSINDKTLAEDKKTNRVEQLENEIEMIKAKVERKEKTSSVISQDIRRVEKENRMYDIGFRTSRLESLTSLLRVKEADKEHILGDMKELQASVDDLKQRLKKLELTNGDMEKEIKEHEDRIKLFYNQNIKITNEIDELETAHNKVRRELERVEYHQHLPSYESRHTVNYPLRHHHLATSPTYYNSSHSPYRHSSHSPYHGRGYHSRERVNESD